MEEREWLRQCALHLVCILYALLGAPWIALKFPMMFLLVLDVTPTAYVLLTRPPLAPMPSRPQPQRRQRSAS